MATWTVKFADRTDGVIMLGGNDLNMTPINETGRDFPSYFPTGYCCFTCDNEFTVNDNPVTVQNDDNGFEEDGGATVTVKA